MTVDATELSDAVDFASIDGSSGNEAFIELQTGKIYVRSAQAGMQDDGFPEDIDDPDQYLPVPSTRDLGLGSRVALAFAAEEMPGDYDIVSDIFRQRGAFRRFKILLDQRDKLERWYEYQEQAKEEALADWCEANGIEMDLARPETDPSPSL